tara:strand:+ start:100 stop:609 length:510 start_codon:yes stop_codon:yes gene_type:complete
MEIQEYSSIDFDINNNMEEKIKDTKEYNELQQNIISAGELIYILDNNNNENEKNLFPLNPEIQLQQIGSDINVSNIDINSELLNLDKPLNRDVTNNLKNSNTTEEKTLETIPFNTEHTTLTNPAINIKGMTKNRWLELHLNPQDNSIEPFSRTGDNSVLNTLDTFEKCY